MEEGGEDEENLNPGLILLTTNKPSCCIYLRYIATGQYRVYLYMLWLYDVGSSPPLAMPCLFFSLPLSLFFIAHIWNTS